MLFEVLTLVSHACRLNGIFDGAVPKRSCCNWYVEILADLLNDCEPLRWHWCVFCVCMCHPHRVQLTIKQQKPEINLFGFLIQLIMIWNLLIHYLCFYTIVVSTERERRSERQIEAHSNRYTGTHKRYGHARMYT